MDDTDLTAWHIFNTENDELISYCRVYHAQDGTHIGRVLVAQKHRNGGKAKDLMLRALTLAKREYPHENIMVQAQAHLQNFYSSLGFVPTSEVYLEDNIPHIDMILQNAA
ncbi:GNAT family N-acetyltransferase [Kingella negevensis]|uniref:GNAT family N-acetyltransferase n=1 Tax=Kingella negevensis TaxID=1522312 RepID=UPI0025516E5C|nr:GNAT family N-acetyltransferase [Kingella negevensis]MDK4681045.1 GNAT family N-acetyltransferase [Kingella negevensis]MDK4683247.1 GNAT family N-acetyltransferase [Kingella negevensis]MDK4691621.1 GNAT family N-acetyltransferase [Kingella negevensis]MDK4693228.1 GNAT family N-acetyltransferase [Kingella negevensis]MDK4699528.1 GNAT family N-acetyltransferase [Kingella negevensis]